MVCSTHRACEGCAEWRETSASFTFLEHLFSAVYVFDPELGGKREGGVCTNWSMELGTLVGFLLQGIGPEDSF